MTLRDHFFPLPFSYRRGDYASYNITSVKISKLNLFLDQSIIIANTSYPLRFLIDNTYRESEGSYYKFYWIERTKNLNLPWPPADTENVQTLITQGNIPIICCYEMSITPKLYTVGNDYRMLAKHPEAEYDENGVHVWPLALYQEGLTIESANSAHIIKTKDDTVPVKLGTTYNIRVEAVAGSEEDGIFTYKAQTDVFSQQSVGDWETNRAEYPLRMYQMRKQERLDFNALVSHVNRTQYFGTRSSVYLATFINVSVDSSYFDSSQFRLMEVTFDQDAFKYKRRIYDNAYIKRNFSTKYSADLIDAGVVPRNTVTYYKSLFYTRRRTYVLQTTYRPPVPIMSSGPDLSNGSVVNVSWGNVTPTDEEERDELLEIVENGTSFETVLNYRFNDNDDWVSTKYNTVPEDLEDNFRTLILPPSTESVAKFRVMSPIELNQSIVPTILVTPFERILKWSNVVTITTPDEQQPTVKVKGSFVLIPSSATVNEDDGLLSYDDTVTNTTINKKAATSDPVWHVYHIMTTFYNIPPSVIDVTSFIEASKNVVTPVNTLVQLDENMFTTLEILIANLPQLYKIDGVWKFASQLVGILGSDYVEVLGHTSHLTSVPPEYIIATWAEQGWAKLTNNSYQSTDGSTYTLPHFLTKEEAEKEARRIFWPPSFNDLEVTASAGFYNVRRGHTVVLNVNAPTIESFTSLGNETYEIVLSHLLPSHSDEVYINTTHDNDIIEKCTVTHKNMTTYVLKSKYEPRLHTSVADVSTSVLYKVESVKDNGNMSYSLKLTTLPDSEREEYIETGDVCTPLDSWPSLDSLSQLDECSK